MIAAYNQFFSVTFNIICQIHSHNMTNYSYHLLWDTQCFHVIERQPQSKDVLKWA